MIHCIFIRDEKSEAFGGTALKARERVTRDRFWQRSRRRSEVEEKDVEIAKLKRALEKSRQLVDNLARTHDQP